jgi:ATP-dependent RNA helicase DDX27
MAPDDFVMTLDSEEESPPDAINLSKHPSSKEADGALLDPAFIFDMSGDPYTDLIHGGADFADLVKSGSKPVRSFGASSGSLNIVRLGSNIRR